MNETVRIGATPRTRRAAYKHNQESGNIQTINQTCSPIRITREKVGTTPRDRHKLRESPIIDAEHLGKRDINLSHDELIDEEESVTIELVDAQPSLSRNPSACSHDSLRPHNSSENHHSSEFNDNEPVSFSSKFRTFMLDPTAAIHEDEHGEMLDYEAEVADDRFDATNIPTHQSIKHDEIRSLLLTALKLIITTIIGVSVGLIGFSVSKVIHWLIKLNIGLLNQSMTNDHPNRAFALTLLYSTGLTLIGALCVAFGSWFVKGSGVGRINAYLSGVTSSARALTLNTLINKCIGLCASVAAGIKQGMEGPFIHIGAMLGLHVSGALVWLCSTIARFAGQPRLIHSLFSAAEQRMFISSGAAAGFSVAFNAPLAGVLYVQDGAFAYWSGELTLRSFVCTMVAVMTINLCYLKGDGSLPSRGLLDLEDQPAVKILLQEFWAFLLLGVIGGLLGAGFTALNVHVEKKRGLYLGSRRLLVVLDALLCAISTVLMSFSLPFLFNCKPRLDICDDHADRCLRFQCPPDSYSPIATLFFSLPESAVRMLFDRSEASDENLTLAVLIIFCAAYFLMSALTYGMAVPGGLFIPSVIIGGCFGRIVGIVLGSNSGVYAVLGAASMLGGITRMTLPITVMMIEITSDAQFLIPIMLVVILAKAISDRCIGALYSEHLRLDGLVLAFGDSIPRSLKRMSARQVMGRHIIKLPVVATVSQIRAALSETEYSAFPVCDSSQSTIQRIRGRSQTGQSNAHAVAAQLQRSTSDLAPPVGQLHGGTYLGLIARRHLILALNHAETFDTEHAARDSHPMTIKPWAERSIEQQIEHTNNNSAGRASPLPEHVDQFVGWNARSPVLQPSPHHSPGAFINLCQHVDQGAYMVSEETSARRVWALFRSLGMRHISVLDRRHEPVGIITRRDLLAHAVAQI